MRLKVVLFYLLSLVFLQCCTNQGNKPMLSVKVTPMKWQANSEGILNFTFRLNHGALQPGDNLTISIPGSWTTHLMHPYKGRPNQPYSMMTAEMMEDIHVSSPNAANWKLDMIELGSDDSDHRFSRRLTLVLKKGVIDAGEKLHVTYGSEKDPIHASFLAQKTAFPIKLFHNDSLIINMPKELIVETIAESPKELLVTLPSQGVVDEKVKLHVTALDRYGNPTVIPDDLVIRGADEAIALPEESVSANGKFAEFDVQFETVGFKTVDVGNDDFEYVQSNPIKVFEEEPEFKLLWGDLHSHSHMSRDGIGNNPFKYARDYANLDFYALTDHASSDSGVAGITDEEWLYIQKQVRSFYRPGEFTTLLAYEASFSHPYGHHNIYFLTDDAPLYREHEMKTLPRLWQMLEDKEAFTVPHHTGIAFNEEGKGAAVDWSIQHHSEKTDLTHSSEEDINHSHEKSHSIRPLVEVYSAHGQSELYDPNHPLSYDQFVLVQRWKEWYTIGDSTAPNPYRNMSLAHSVKGPYYIRDGWAEGLRLGIIASSDDHTARPGQPYKGLAAVWASENNRDSVFNALVNKQTYGTTGQRIYLDFRANNNLQGQTLKNPKRIEFSIEIAGTDTLDWIELVQFDASTLQYKTIKEWKPNLKYATFSYSLDNQLQAGFYYVRLCQRKQVSARDVMAWSSPIWIE